MDMYFDAAATTKPTKSTIESIKPYIEKHYYNPSALYSGGKAVRDKIEEVRKQIADMIGANPNEIYFTSGATESNNWVMRGFLDEYEYRGHIITSPIEHNSIISFLNGYAKNLYNTYCNVDSEGFVDYYDIRSDLEVNQNTHVKSLVSIIYGNNEIGTIQNIAELSELTHRYNGIFHTDATQVFGHLPINVDELGIDLMSASAQKINGIKGCGFLYIRNGVKIKPLIYGSQENGMRGGTENVIGIVAFGEALKNVDYSIAEKMSQIRDEFIKLLVNDFSCRINGSMKYRLPNNINVTFPQNITGEALIYMLETSGIYISAGSACNSHSVKPSYVLQSIGLSDEDISKTIRITIPPDSNGLEIAAFLHELGKTIKILTMEN